MRSLFRFTSWSLLACTYAAIALWCIGRAFNDSVYAFQYVFWVPSILWIAAGIFSVSLSWLFALMAQPHLPASFAPDDSAPVQMMRFPRVAQKTRFVAGSCLLGISLYTFVIELNMLRALRDRPAAAAHRIAFWNAATDFMDDYADRFVATGANIFALSNPAAYCEWEKIRLAAGPESDARRYGRLAVVSPWRITRWGGTSLEVSGAQERRFGDQSFFDRGVAMFAELDSTKEFGRPIVIWVVDLPSDIAIPRKRMLQEARAAIDGFSGPVLTTGKNGMDERVDAPVGFPSPDIIVGDFNTPRGSRSLARLVGSMEHAYDRAGHGLMFTWDRDRPLVAIDHVFVGDDIEVVNYESRDAGRGRHLIQIADFNSRN